MKAKFFLPILILFLFAIGCSQTDNSASKLNLSFEDVQNGMPESWYIFSRQSGYLFSLDSINVKSGKYAIAIESTADSGSFQAVAFDLPQNYDGQ